MKSSRRVGVWKGQAFLWLFLLGIGVALDVSAGETSVYLKPGWFSLRETVNGGTFVKEDGPLYAAGIKHHNDLKWVSVGERFEVWGGNIDYDGHDVTGTSSIKSDTTYFGTREEMSLWGRLPAGALLVEPLLGVGHKFWIRTLSNENWNTFYAKAGGGGSWGDGGRRIFAMAGALVPIYTRVHSELSNTGYSEVVTEPESEVSAFAEGGVKLGAFSVSVEYEGMAFGQSDKVRTTRVMNQGSGVVIVNTTAYQPATSSTLISLRVGYTF